MYGGPGVRKITFDGATPLALADPTITTGGIIYGFRIVPDPTSTGSYSGLIVSSDAQQKGTLGGTRQIGVDGPGSRLLPGGSGNVRITAGAAGDYYVWIMESPYEDIENGDASVVPVPGSSGSAGTTTATSYAGVALSSAAPSANEGADLTNARLVRLLATATTAAQTLNALAPAFKGWVKSKAGVWYRCPDLDLSILAQGAGLNSYGFDSFNAPVPAGRVYWQTNGITLGGAGANTLALVYEVVTP